MQDPTPLNPGDEELESALRSLAPVAASIDPLAAAFAAGQRAARHGGWIWPGVGAAGLAMGLLVGWSVANRPVIVAPPNSPSTVLVTAGAVNTPSRPMPEQSMFRLQQAVLDGGVDALPPIQGQAAEPMHINSSSTF